MNKGHAGLVDGDEDLPDEDLKTGARARARGEGEGEGEDEKRKAGMRARRRGQGCGNVFVGRSSCTRLVKCISEVDSGQQRREGRTKRANGSRERRGRGRETFGRDEARERKRALDATLLSLQTRFDAR